MLYLGSAHAEGQGGKCAVGAGVRVPGHHRHTGQGRSLLGPNDVDDSLARVVQAKLSQARFTAVDGQLLDLGARQWIAHAGRSIARGHVVVGSGQHGVGSPDAPPGFAQASKACGLVTS